MRPVTPHFVYGSENTICYGGNYYLTCLMQETLFSLVHSFVISEFIMNITHHPSRQLLRQIVLFYGLGLVENRLKVEGRPHCSTLHSPMCSTQIRTDYTDFARICMDSARTTQIPHGFARTPHGLHRFRMNYAQTTHI